MFCQLNFKAKNSFSSVFKENKKIEKEKLKKKERKTRNASPFQKIYGGFDIVDPFGFGGSSSNQKFEKYQRSCPRQLVYHLY